MELKTCPFCGCEALGPLPVENGYAAYCGVCEYHGPFGSNEDVAILAWNLRDGEEKDNG
jgi:Lar family restriction alleviation protein